MSILCAYNLKLKPLKALCSFLASSRVDGITGGTVKVAIIYLNNLTEKC